MVKFLAKDVLLVKSRPRQLMALPVLGLDEFGGARNGSYADLADQILIRAPFTDPLDTPVGD